MGCSFCEGIKHKDGQTGAYLQLEKIQGYVTSCMCWDNSGGEKPEGKMKIYYCPMCGDSLMLKDVVLDLDGSICKSGCYDEVTDTFMGHPVVHIGEDDERS